MFEPIPISLSVFHLFSDAAVEKDKGGLGGWAHGDYWHITLSAEECTLMHISAWEFMALAINILIYGPRLAGHLVRLFSDALATVQIIGKGAARSHDMQIIHDLVVHRPEYPLIIRKGLQEHIYGEVNVFADSASRKKFSLIGKLAEQFGIQARRIYPPRMVFDFIDEVKSAIRCSREQSRDEINRMHHLGNDFLGADDNPIEFPLIVIERPESPKCFLNSTASVVNMPHPSLSSSLKRRAESPPISSKPDNFVGPTAPINCSLAIDARAFHEVTTRCENIPVSVIDHYPYRRTSFQDHSYLPPFVGSMGVLPPVPSSHRLVDDMLRRPSSHSIASPLVQALLSDSDSSGQAIRPTDLASFLAYSECVSYSWEHAVPSNTAKKNRASWAHWVSFTKELGTAALRIQRPETLMRDRFLSASFIIWLRSRCSSSIQGRKTVKPSTLLGHLHAVGRVHDIQGLSFDRKSMIGSTIRYLCLEYEKIHGPESLVPHRREGFSRAIIRRLLQAVDNLHLPSRKYSFVPSSSWLSFNIKAAICASSAGGFRKAEISLAPGVEFDAMHMSRASLFFIISGNIVRAPSKLQLENMVLGDKVGLLSVPCKNDPLGMHFLPFPLIFNFKPNDEADSGLALRNLALFCWVPPAELRSTPMFTYSEQKEPFRYDFLDMVLKALLITFLSSAALTLYSWHSFRIGLACALIAALAPYWVILALCRWRSPASIPGYGRINMEAGANWIDEAGRRDVGSLQASNLPGLDDFSAVPNALPAQVYDFLGRADILSESLTDQRLESLQLQIPDVDDDTFMRDFSNVTQTDIDSEI